MQDPKKDAPKITTNWPKKRRLIGTKISRQDGAMKATGKAKYSYDKNLPGMLHAVILRSSRAHAKVKTLDTAAAEKMPGVKAVHIMNGVGKELFFAGDEIVALAADTEEHAHDAMRAIKVEYEDLDFFVLEDDSRAAKKRTVGGKGDTNLSKPQTFNKGDVEAAYKEADAVAGGTYGANVICHQCLEPHGLVATWDEDGNLTVYASTQATFGTAKQLADHFQIAGTKVKCITHHMGGGYGSKFGPDPQGIVAAELSKKTGKPVKLMLDRADEITVGGNRPSAYGTIKIAGKKDGRITAFEVTSYGTPGYRGGATVNFALLPYVYGDAIPNIKREHTVVFTNGGPARAMRAPGHPQNCILTEFAVDDLAAKLDLEPMRFRLENLPPNDLSAALANPVSYAAMRETLYKEQLRLIAEQSDWYKKWHKPGQGPKKGPWKHGIGMALHTWGGFAAGGDPNECTVRIHSSGAITASTSTQDLGTAQRSVTQIVVAEILGREVNDITLQIGESQLGVSSGSGGSTTCPSQAPAALLAATDAKNDLFAKVAPKVGSKPENLTIELGKVVDATAKKEWTWAEFCAKLGMAEARGEGKWGLTLANDPENARLSSGQVGGVQIAEVWVDVETGVAKCTEFWAIQDCGLLINKLACESQVAGGVIMGLNYALFEERIMDRHTGRQVNPDMEFYKLGGIQDMPKIHVHMQDMPERGVIGIGEPPTISTAAAIGNAIMNAIGVRVPIAPFTPQRVLEALTRK